jgi:pilus assembly protein Flp/PilA
MWYPRNSENGQGLVEYALILVLIAVVVIAILTLLGDQVDMVFARILLQIEHPGDYSGDPLTVEQVNSTAYISEYSGNLLASATVDFEDPQPTGSPNICVQFTSSEHGSKLVCDSAPSVTFSGGTSGTVQACVIGVQGYTLRGTSCTSATY